MPLIILFVGFVLLGLFYIFYFKEDKKEIKAKTAEELNNVDYIKDSIMYGLDGQIFQYIRVFPISVDLYSPREQEVLTDELTARFSLIEDLSFRFLGVSRPVDISQLINELQELLQESNNPKQREILKKEIAENAKFALEGDVVERQFYFRVHGTEKTKEEMKRKAFEICKILNENKIEAKICDDYDIIKLGNMIAHPQYVYVEQDDIDNMLPMLNGMK